MEGCASAGGPSSQGVCHIGSFSCIKPKLTAFWWCSLGDNAIGGSSIHGCIDHVGV